MRISSVYENIAGGKYLFMKTLQEESICLLKHCWRNASVNENIEGGIHQFMRTLQEECISL